MNTDVDDLMRRTKSYWYEDGLVEILAGLFFGAIGLLLLLDWVTPAGAVYKWIFAPGFAVVTVLWILSGRRVIEWLKQRITYPRTGYVVYRQQPRASRRLRAVVAGVLGATVAIAFAAAVTQHTNIVRMAPLLMGAGVGLLLLRIGSEVAVFRFHILAIWSLIVGAALAALTHDLGLGVALYYVLLGPAIVCAGVVTLVRYLRAARETVDD